MSDEAPTSVDRIGSTLGGRWLLSRVLGEGGMGSVFEAVDARGGGVHAVKVMHDEFAKDGPAVARFLREAELTMGLRHPNVVACYEVGTDPTSGAPYLVQERLSGQTLRALLDARGRLTVQEALEVVTPVMSALVFIHAAGVVHRDVKPENIFLARDAFGQVTPKLLDFGISKRAEGVHELRLTSTGMAVGTPFYMSPEQARSERVLDGRSDVWALGVVLYECLAGRGPFDAEVYNLLMVQILTQDPPRLDALRPEVPRALADVVHKALARELPQRHRDMRAMLRAVLDCEALLRASWHDTLRETQLRLLEALPEPAAPRASPVARGAPHRGVLAAVFVAVLAVVALAGAVLGRARPAPQRALAATVAQRAPEAPTPRSTPAPQLVAAPVAQAVAVPATAPVRAAPVRPRSPRAAGTPRPRGGDAAPSSGGVRPMPEDF